MKKKMKKQMMIILCALFALMQCIGLEASEQFGSNIDEANTNTSMTDEEAMSFEAGVVLVTIKHEESAIDRTFSAEDFPNVNIESIEYVTPLMEEKKGLFDWENYRQILKINLTDKEPQAVLDAIDILSQNVLVESAKPNWIIPLYYGDERGVEITEPGLLDFDEGLLAAAQLQATVNAVTPNDKYYVDQYALKITGINKAWTYSTGSSNIKVGVLDSGISTSDFYYNGKTGENLINGYDFVKDEVVKHSSIDPHGTEVAGIIGAVGNNGVSISGINWRVSMVNLRIADINEENKVATSPYYIGKAVMYAAQNGIKVLNISYAIPESGRSEYVTCFDNYAGLVVLGAGNDGRDINGTVPIMADCENVIVVASTNKEDRLSEFSNYGSKAVQLAAPGEEIYTVKENSDTAAIPVSGTSFSTPMVTGTAALMMSVDDTAPMYQIKRNILESVDKLDSLKGKTSTGGRLNGLNAVEAVINQQKYNYKVLIGYKNNPRSVNMFEARCSYQPFYIHYDGAIKNVSNVYCTDGMEEGEATSSIIEISETGGFDYNSKILVELKFSSPAFSDTSSAYYSKFLKPVISKLTSNGDYEPTPVTEIILMGDIDGNGKIESADSLKILQNVVELSKLTENQKIAADVNGDGEITAADANKILQYVTENVHSFW